MGEPGSGYTFAPTLKLGPRRKLIIESANSGGFVVRDAERGNPPIYAGDIDGALEAVRREMTQLREIF